MSSNQAMRREVFFSGDSPYELLVRGNVLLHRQAAAKLAEQVGAIVDLRPPEAQMRVLDLACGGVPFTMATAMEEFPHRSFHYTGVDINRQQVEKAGRFPFSPNVEAEIFEGSAWDLRPLSSRAPFDLIFVSLNWHHGTPEELWFMARHSHSLLEPDGRLVNHDCYRPDRAPHVSRPETVDEGGELSSLAMVEPSVLAAAGVPGFGIKALPAGTPTAWRTDLIDRLERGYLDNGGGAAGARILTDHSANRDFPLSVADARRVLRAAGFEAASQRYEAEDGPLAEYLAMLTACPMPETA